MNRCILCGSEFFQKPLIECDNMPKSAQHFPTIPNSDDSLITLKLVQCSGCGLVQLDVNPVSYYRDVIRSGGYSSTMHNLRNQQYKRFLEKCPMTNKRIIEVGCGKGEFLQVWRDENFPVDAYGVENNTELVDIAVKEGLNVSVGFTESENTFFHNGPFDGFCSFNFLEHQPNPNVMLRCIYNNLKEEAYGLVTVPSFEYILEQESYYELIRDHIAYFTKESFCFLLEKNGFHVLSCEIVNRDTWEAIVEKKKPLNTNSIKKNKICLSEELQHLLEKVKTENKKIAVWGASHQSLTILSSMRLHDSISYVIDSAPFKQGKYTIGSNIPIVAPSYILNEHIDVVLIIAPGYTDEIARIVQNLNREIEIYSLRSNHLELYHNSTRR